MAYQQGTRAEFVVPSPRAAMKKKHITYGVIAATFLVVVLCGLWPSLMPPVQASVIGAVVTVVTAAVGAALLFWQIGQQAQNAIKANRETEAAKLKKEVYEEIVKGCRAQRNADGELTTFIHSFNFALGSARAAVNSGVGYKPPDARAARLIGLFYEASKRSTELMALQERYEIIDPRTSIFRSAFACATREIDKAWRPYFDQGLAAIL